MKKCFIIFALFFILASSVETPALPLGKHAINIFEGNALRCAKALFKQVGVLYNDDYSIQLNDCVINGVLVRKADIAISGLDSKTLETMKNGTFSFADLRKTVSIAVNYAEISADSIQSVINREINRVNTEKRIFHSADLSFGSGQVRIVGKIDMTKVPGNPLALIPQTLSEFDVTISVKLLGSQIHLELIRGQMNGQVMTDDVKSLLLGWLNPVWDFSILPYNAGLDGVELTPNGIKACGSLF